MASWWARCITGQASTSGLSTGSPRTGGTAACLDLEAQTEGIPCQDEHGNAATTEPLLHNYGPPGRASTSAARYVRQLVPVPTKETHRVLVIHGTFDAPSNNSGRVPWYQLDPANESGSNFCNVLKRDLEPSWVGGEAVWRELPGGLPFWLMGEKKPYTFCWTGGNTHVERVRAGRHLCKIINAIGKEDPSARIHLVAHSHGGNVVLAAVSEYISILRRECNDKSYDVKIRKDFWEKHTKGYQDVFAFKSSHDASVSFFKACLGPLLILRRPWRGEESLGDFSWGYWWFTDWLLGLGKRRQVEYMRRKWAGGASTNALGQLVFMGTPFYTKHSIGLPLVKRVARGALTMAIPFLYALLVMVIVGSDLSAYEWSSILALILACSTVPIGVMSEISRTHIREGNLYFNETRAWPPHMRALVLNAGKLDEAFLALSLEPVVRTCLIRELERMLTPNVAKNLMEELAFDGSYIRDFGDGDVWSPWVLALGPGYLLRLPAACLYSLLHFCFNSLLVKAISSSLLNLFITLAFGLPKRELDNGKVFVDEYLRLDSAPEGCITHANVHRILTGAANDQLTKLMVLEARHDADVVSTPEVAQEPERQGEEGKPTSSADRRAFHSDDGELDKRAERCTMWQWLGNEMEQIPMNPRMSRSLVVRNLKLMCVELEERCKEMSSIKLSHGSYFRNRAVIAAISHFVVHGVPPEWMLDVADLVHLVPGIANATAINSSV